MLITDRINEVFGGNLHDKRPLRINSICRIAYCGFLIGKNLKAVQIVEITDWNYKAVLRRIKAHKKMYEEDEVYKSIYDRL